MTELREIPLNQLHASDLQPRLGLHQETVAGFVSAIADAGQAFPKESAITVRPRTAGGFEILSGHHRTAAAIESGLSTVWAFVKPLDDLEAAKLVVASNNQTSLTWIEHGRAAKALNAKGVSFNTYSKIVGKHSNTVMNAVWGVDVLERTGGFDTPFAAISVQILAAARSIPDDDLVSRILNQVLFERMNQTEGLTFVDRIKKGERFIEAMNKLQASRKPKPVERDHGEETMKSNPALMAWGAASFSISQADAVLRASFYQAAMLEELMSRFGSQVAADPTFFEAVMKRRDALVQEHEDDEQARADEQAQTWRQAIRQSEAIA